MSHHDAGLYVVIVVIVVLVGFAGLISYTDTQQKAWFEKMRLHENEVCTSFCKSDSFQLKRSYRSSDECWCETPQGLKLGGFVK